MTTATRSPGQVDLVVPPPTIAARVERVFLEREVAGGQRLSARALAQELGASRATPTQTLRRLRALRRRDPGLGMLRTRFAAIQRMTAAELATAAGQARRQHAEVIEAGCWWWAAACRGMDTDLFFLAGSDRRGASARAKRVCASCPVRVECLRAELTAPIGVQPDGIVGGLAPWERTRLRVDAGVDAHVGDGRFLADRALTEQAHRHACQVGIGQAAVTYGTGRATLKRAFDRWGLPDLPARPPRFATRGQAAAAYRLALRVGIMAAAHRLGAADRTLRAAFALHGLAWPPPPRPRVRLVDPVFFQLNPQVVIPRRLSPASASAWVRRQEDFEVLGARVVYALGEENHPQPHRRAWHLAQRVRQARQAALAAHLATHLPSPLAAIPAVEADRSRRPSGTSGQPQGRTAA
jgi:WhiB family redox-sensing transcriptional regulator